MDKVTADSIIRGEMEYCKWWEHDDRNPKKVKGEENWCEIISGNGDKIARELLKKAKHILARSDDDTRNIVGTFISTNTPLWLELVGAILVCSTAIKDGSDKVKIKNSVLMELHSNLLGKKIQDKKSPRLMKSNDSEREIKQLIFTWEHKSILAVVTFVRNYYLFFEDKDVIWEN